MGLYISSLKKTDLSVGEALIGLYLSYPLQLADNFKALKEAFDKPELVPTIGKVGIEILSLLYKDGLVDSKVFDVRTNGVYHELLDVLTRDCNWSGGDHDNHLVEAVSGVSSDEESPEDRRAIHAKDKASRYLQELINEKERREILVILHKVTEEISAGQKQPAQAIEEIRSIKLKNDSAAPALSAQIDASIKELKGFSDKGVEISFGISQLDKNYSMRRGNLLVVGAPTSHGKTALVTSAVTVRALKDHAKANLKVLYNCHEDYHVFPFKFASALFKHDLSEFIHSYRLSPMAQEEIYSKLELSKAYSSRLVVTPGITISEMRKVASSFKPDIIILDYLQKHVATHFGSDSLRESCAKVTSDLQDIVRESKAYGVLTSQIRRREFAKMDKASYSGVLRKPSLSDLKESGDIENCADSVIILWWPWRDLNTEQATGVDKSKYIIQVAKDKLGPGCEVECKFDGATLSFEDKFKI